MEHENTRQPLKFPSLPKQKQPSTNDVAMNDGDIEAHGSKAWSLFWIKMSMRLVYLIDIHVCNTINRRFVAQPK